MCAETQQQGTSGSAEDWISLQEASDLLGVATSTLRRWGDDGRLPMKRTLGGHRRFPRLAVLQLAEHPEQLPKPAAAAITTADDWGVDAHSLSRQDWHNRLAEHGDALRMRGLGQRLLGLLIQYVNRREDDARFLAEARAIGANYGSEARSSGISMHDTVEAFLFFRSSFSLLAMPFPGIAQPHDLAQAEALHARIDQFMNATLLGTIAGYDAAV